MNKAVPPAFYRRFDSPLLYLFLLAAWTFLIYSNTWQNEFVFDSRVKVVDNPQIRTLDGVFSHPYRWVSNLSYHLNYLWSGADPAAYQITSIVLHILTGWSIFWLALLLFPEDNRRRLMAFLAALFFILHPLNSEALNYLNGRPMLLATLFAVLELIFFIKAFPVGEEPVRPWSRVLLAGLSLACVVLSVFSKETGLAILAVMVFYFFSFHVVDIRGWLKARRRWFPLLGALIVVPVGIVFFFQLRPAASMDTQSPLRHLFSYWMTQCGVAQEYLGLAILPLPSRLNVDHHVVLSGISLKTIAGIAVVSACIVAVVVLWKRHRLVSLGIFWMLVTHAPTSLVPRADLMVEYRNYTPMVGFVLVMIPILKWLFERRGPVMRTGIVMLVLILYSAAVWTRNGVWRTAETLWTDSVVKSPDKARPRVGLALACLHQLQSGAIRDERLWVDRGEKGLREIEAAVRLEPDFYQAYPIGAGLNLFLARYDEAIRWCDRVITLIDRPGMPDDQRRVLADVYNVRGIIHLNRGNVAQMIEECMSAIRYQPDYLAAYENVTLGYLVTGRFTLAKDYLKRGLVLVPEQPILKMRQVLIDGIEHPVRWKGAVAELVRMPPRLLQSELAQIERFSRDRQLLEAVKKLKGAVQ